MSEPVNLLEVDANRFKEFIDSFDYIFSDCDGVIWTRAPLPGSGEFFSLMKKYGKTIKYVSNNSLRNPKNYDDKFKAAGIEDGYENLTVPSIAIAEYLKSINFSKKVYSVACAQTCAVLKSYGIEYKDGPDVGPDQYTEYVQYLEDDPEIGAVVFDSDFRINLPKMYKAKTYLTRPDVLFINGATDKFVPFGGGRLEIATGAFTELVAELVKREPIQLGKPGKMFGEFAMKRAGVTDPSRVLFIGDMIEQDIGLGKAVGFKTLLVLTSASEEKMRTHAIKPDYYAPDLGSLIPQLTDFFPQNKGTFITATIK